MLTQVGLLQTESLIFSAIKFNGHRKHIIHSLINTGIHFLIANVCRVSENFFLQNSCHTEKILAIVTITSPFPTKTKNTLGIFYMIIPKVLIKRFNELIDSALARQSYFIIQQ